MISISIRTTRLAMVLAASLAAAGFAAAQGPVGAGTADAMTATALPAQPEPNASAKELPVAANASRAAQPDTGGSYSDNADYITGDQRALWVIQSTVGWQSLAYGVIPAGVGTALNHPREYGTHWEGFGDRYGMRLAGLATSNTMEASLGAIWHENPRYKPEPEKS